MSGTGFAPIWSVGQGPAFAQAILAFGVDRFVPERLRLLILHWNERLGRSPSGSASRRTAPSRASRECSSS